MNTDALVDAATVAANLGQAKSSIYRLAQAGLIPSYAAGPCMTGRRFNLNEVREALRITPAKRRAPAKEAGK